MPITISYATHLLRYAALLCIVVGLFVLAFLFGNTPTQEANRLGLRGYKRQRELQQNETWAQVEPAVRWLGIRLSGFVKQSFRQKIDIQLSLAGDYMGLTPDEFIALTILSTLGGITFGAVVALILGYDPFAFGLLGGIVIATLPYSKVSEAGEERLKAVSRGLPYVTDLMALSMSAGLDFPGAIRQVVEKSSNPNDPIVEEFTLILQTVNLGRTRKEALLEFGKRCPVDSVIEFVNAIVQAEERGNPIAEVLIIQAGVSRNRRSVRAEELASKAAMKLMGPLILVFFVVLGLILIPSLMNIQTML